MSYYYGNVGAVVAMVMWECLITMVVLICTKITVVHTAMVCSGWSASIVIS